MEIKLCYRKYLEIGNSNSSFVKVLSLMHCFLFLNNPLSKWCERMLNKVSFHMHPSSILLLTSLIKCYYFLCLSSVRKAIVVQFLSDSCVQVKYQSRLYSCIPHSGLHHFIFHLQKITFHGYYLDLIISLPKVWNHFHLLLR